MKINWTLFLSYLFVWGVLGIMMFEKIVPITAFMIFGGVCGGLILATKKTTAM